MREIKFRAWARCGEWLETEDKQAFKMISAADLAFDEYVPLVDNLRDVDDEIYFMQYTGLKDKNGIEIYEGDIIERDKNCLFDAGRVNTVVKFENGCFWGDKGPLYNITDSFNPVAIGNIYENPELLESV